MNFKQIQNVLISIRPDLVHKYGIREIGVFGSTARNEAGPDSDIDILVDFSTPVSFFQFAEMEHYLSGILEGRVDLVMKDSLKPHIGKQILKEVRYL